MQQELRKMHLYAVAVLLLCGLNTLNSQVAFIYHSVRDNQGSNV